MIISKIKKFLLNPFKLFSLLGSKNKLKFINDKLYLKLIFRGRIGKRLNLTNPKTFSEKIQWLKLYDRNPLYTTLVDKYEVRSIIRQEIGEDYLIPLIGVWDNFDDINFDELPNSFVLKCTHDSGGVIIVKNKNDFNINIARKKINSSLKKNYFYSGREWPYKNVKPRIIIEKFMVDTKSKQLKDYKLMCFNGSPKIIQVMSNRISGKYNLNHYSLNWESLNYERVGLLRNKDQMEKPENLEQMIDFANKLSKGIPFVRLDFYEVNGKLYFGEFTLYPASGFYQFENISSDIQLGNMLYINCMERKIS